MAEPTSCCTLPGGYCARVDTLFNMPGVHVLEVVWRERSGRIPAGLRLLVETDPGGVVGDQLHPTRHRLGGGGGPASRGGLAHRVGRDQATARRAGR